jgi:hypothetical protein
MDNSTAREIRKEFFAYRNGIVADKLRKAGDPHPVIMGCLLVDVMSITGRVRQEINDDAHLQSLAQELWNDTNSRECRLAAPMLYPAPLMTHDTDLQWCDAVETAEVADNLCHKLLRHRPDADTLFRQLIVDDRALVKYTGYRLLLNRLLMGKVPPSASLRAIVEHEAAQAQAPLKNLLKDILEELD